ncbi:MAG: cytochrome c [Nitrospirota bacterium]
METKIETSKPKRRRVPVPLQVAIIWIGVYLFLKFFIRPPLPSSLIFMYMTMTSIGLGVYVSIYEDMLQGFLRPIVDFLRGDPLRAWTWRASRWVLLVTIPVFVGYGFYQRVAPRTEPPIGSRVIHPAPPREFAQLVNPVPHTKMNLLIGKGLYTAYCSPCHGKDLDGKGIAARGFNPPPANFVDVGTIAQLQESYLFWRISNGGVGLPSEGEPWNTAMPRWDTRISSENIWKIIMYEFEGSGHVPRTWD